MSFEKERPTSERLPSANKRSPEPTPSPVPDRPLPRPPVVEPQPSEVSQLPEILPLPPETEPLPLWPPEYVDLPRFNALVGDESELKWVGQPIAQIERLFCKPVILDDETIQVETLKVPGFIGISDQLEVQNPEGKTVSGHEDIARFLARDGLLIGSFQWNKERYGVPIDTRQDQDEEVFKEAFIKIEAHHAGALVPALRPISEGKLMHSFASLNQPDNYHDGMYGKDGFVTVVQRLAFPDFVTAKQARGYVDSVVCWMTLLNPFVKFPQDYNGGDPTRISDRSTLKEFLRNGLLACLGNSEAIAFFQDAANKTYCAEFMYVCLNSALFPFNQTGLLAVLPDAQKVRDVFAVQAQHNLRQPTILSRTSRNPELKGFNIPMPKVPEDLPLLDQLMIQNGQTVHPDSLPFPPFRLSHILRRAFRTMLPRYQGYDDEKIAAAQARMMTLMEPALLQQLGLENAPPDDPKVQGLRQVTQAIAQQLQGSFSSYEAFDQVVDQIMQRVDEKLVGAGDRVHFVPPRIYVDLGQNDGDTNLPQGWGFRLETIGALISRTVISPPQTRVPLQHRVLKLEYPRFQGDDVRHVQGALLRAGIQIKVDGVFGPASEKAVKQFQEQAGLAVTGVVDAAVRSQLRLDIEDLR